MDDPVPGARVPRRPNPRRLGPGHPVSRHPAPRRPTLSRAAQTHTGPMLREGRVPPVLASSGPPTRLPPAPGSRRRGWGRPGGGSGGRRRRERDAAAAFQTWLGLDRRGASARQWPRAGLARVSCRPSVRLGARRGAPLVDPAPGLPCNPSAGPPLSLAPRPRRPGPRAPRPSAGPPEAPGPTTRGVRAVCGGKGWGRACGGPGRGSPSRSPESGRGQETRTPRADPRPHSDRRTAGRRRCDVAGVRGESRGPGRRDPSRVSRRLRRGSAPQSGRDRGEPPEDGAPDGPPWPRRVLPHSPQTRGGPARRRRRV